MKYKNPDIILLFAILALSGIGILMVFSSSMYMAAAAGKSLYGPLLKQSVAALIGFILMIVFMKIDYHYLRKYAFVFYVITLVLLIAVLFIGKDVQGAKRWLFGFQPSELSKLALIIVLAVYLSEVGSGMRYFWLGIGIPMLVFIPIGFLIMKEPDLGTTIAIFATIIVMMVIAGARWAHLGLIFALSLVVFAILIVVEPYRWRRIISYLDPNSDPLDAGYQIIQSLYGLGSGGLFGVGLGKGRQKLHYLPQPHSDFIFTTLGEEWGFIGTSVVVGLFFVLAWRGYKIAIECGDAFGSLLAAGITSLITVQAAINIGVVTATLPTTGITLPFISSGGTSLVVNLIGLGILLNISKQS
ncbi:MAG: putative lipid II flippase FtsW [Bacillota bacterium]